jgi:hypothetical protein
VLIVPILALAASPARAQPIGGELIANSYTTGNQNGAAVGMDSTGRFVIVWESTDGQDGSGYGVYGQRYQADGSLIGGEFRVNFATGGNQRFPAVAMNSAGDFVAVYNAPDGDNDGVIGQRFSASGDRLGDEFRVNVQTANYQGGASVAWSNSGFVVVWASDQTSCCDTDIYARIYGSDGTAVTTELLVNTITSNGQRDPKVAVSPGGAFVVTWWSDDTDDTFAQRFDASGSKLGGQFMVNTYTTYAQIRPSVAVDGSGNFVIAWTSSAGFGFGQDGSLAAVIARRYAANGTPLTDEFRVNTVTNSYQGHPSVASDSAGNFLVAWTDAVPGDQATAVSGQLYAASGSQMGGQFHINTYTTGGQRIPAVAGSSTTGHFVVAWESYNGQDGDKLGAIARRVTLSGDANGDGVLDVADIFHLINSLFAGGPASIGSADANGDGKVTVADVFYLINYLFAGGPPPKASP